MYKESFVGFGGVDIRVLEAGNGPQSLVFVHGNSCDADYWADQLQDPALAERYRLIAFDLPGHGKSTHQDEYDMTGIVKLIPDLIERLGLAPYGLVGISFGTYLIGEAASKLNGCSGYFLASPNIINDAHPPASFLLPTEEGYAIVSPAVPDEILDRFARLMVADAPVIAARYKQSYCATDGRFRSAVGEAIVKSLWTDEWAHLSADGQKAAIVFGTEEKLLRTDYLDECPFRWLDQTIFIEGAAHLVNMERPAVFNSLLLEWAQDIFI